jgi:ATP-dependent helicase/nuclease subunit B
MRRQLGLPPVEQAIGFAAHDFLTSACAPEVVLSRAAKDERGAPTTPSRWLSRLAVVLAGGGDRGRVASAPRWSRWATALDAPAGPARPWPRPEPRPPAEARPRELWATDVERLMRDPYAVYARHILRLQPLEPLDADPGGAERGQIIHKALEEFVRAHPDRLPNDALGRLLAIGARLFARQEHRPQVAAVWWPRFERIAAWFCEREHERRSQVTRVASELRGAVQLPGPGTGFTIRARADRIEVGGDGSLVLVDYKTGPVPAKRDVERGLSPQLTIEALIAEAGGFPGIAAGTSSLILFWQLKGGDPAAGVEHDPVGADGDLRQFLGHAREGLGRLLAHFADPATPFVPIPRPEIAPAFNDYEHLARRGEWWGTEAQA